MYIHHNLLNVNDNKTDYIYICISKAQKSPTREVKMSSPSLPWFGVQSYGAKPRSAYPTTDIAYPTTDIAYSEGGMPLIAAKICPDAGQR